MDKDKIKKAKKILRFRHDNSIFYTFDRIFKLTIVKIEKLEPMEDINQGMVYRVKYKYGLNLFNPLSLIFYLAIVILVIIQSVVEGVKEFFGDTILGSYSSTIKIKDE